jgi:hypothetical protein
MKSGKPTGKKLASNLMSLALIATSDSNAAKLPEP